MRTEETARKSQFIFADDDICIQPEWSGNPPGSQQSDSPHIIIRSLFWPLRLVPGTRYILYIYYVHIMYSLYIYIIYIIYIV